MFDAFLCMNLDHGYEIRCKLLQHDTHLNVSPLFMTSVALPSVAPTSLTAPRHLQPLGALALFGEAYEGKIFNVVQHYEMICVIIPCL